MSPLQYALGCLLAVAVVGALVYGSGLHRRTWRTTSEPEMKVTLDLSGFVTAVQRAQAAIADMQPAFARVAATLTRHRYLLGPGGRSLLAVEDATDVAALDLSLSLAERDGASARARAWFLQRWCLQHAEAGSGELAAILTVVFGLAVASAVLLVVRYMLGALS